MTIRYHDFMIFGAHSVYCGLCHGSPSTCTCDVSFLQRYAPDACPTADHELAARQEAVRTAQATPACCPACGQPLPLVVEPPKKVNESWRDREPLL